MALITEDGTGMATAESYSSVAEADTYHGKVNTAAASWANLSTAVKEAALRRATQFIDGRYRFLSERANETQALSFPRVAFYADGQLIAAATIPLRLKDACAELAARAAAADLLADGEDGGTIASESSHLGPMGESKTYIGGKSSVKEYPIVDALLKHLVASGGRIVRS